MKIIITHDNTTVFADCLTQIKPILIDVSNGCLSETFDEETDFDNTEFCIAAISVNDEITALAVYATEEERDYAKFQLDTFLANNETKFIMSERK